MKSPKWWRNNGNNGHSPDNNKNGQPDAGEQTSNSSGSNGPLLRLQIDLHKLGEDRAINSGALQPRQADIDSLCQLAEAMARETRRDTYDPIRKPQHKLREQEYRKALTDRAEAEDALKFSAAEVREREAALAMLRNEPRPEASPAVMWSFVIGIGGTTAPTIHDFLFSAIEDNVLAWFFSIVSSGFLAAVVVWSILGSISATGRRTTANWAGLILGVVISVGLGLFRLAGAVESEEVVLALALTLVEIGLVGLAEFVASGLREHFREWVVEQAAREKAASALEAAVAEHRRRQELRDAHDRKVNAHIEYVEDLDLRHVNLGELIAAAVKAATDGYRQGVAINQGRILKAGGAQ